MTVTARRVLGERYLLGELVGTGGMADVYRATDQVLERAVAIKLLRSSSSDAAERDRFAAEARTLASLSHPGLVTLLDAGILDEHPYLVMELVEGPTWAQALRESGAMDPARVADLGAHVAEALAYAHDTGVVHRDVKPGNILLAPDGRALLTDFGIARLLSQDAGHTKTGDTIGSPAYLSPEQISGEPLSEAVDVYSLGLVLLEALTGRRAYAGSPVEAAIARLSAAPAIPTSLNHGWWNLVRQMTARHPAARPTALEVAATLSSSFTAVPVAEPVTDLDAETAALDLSEQTGATAVPDIEETLVGIPLAVTAAHRARSRNLWWAVTGVLVAALMVTVGVIAFSGPDAPAAKPSYQAPAGVPERMQAPLKSLHHAVYGAEQ